MYVIELGVMMLLGLVVLFMVIRPTDTSAQPAGVPSQSLIPNATAQMIDVAQVQGQVHAQSVHRVGELAERNPNETASILRQWLAEPAT